MYGTSESACYVSCNFLKNIIIECTKDVSIETVNKLAIDGVVGEAIRHVQKQQQHHCAPISKIELLSFEPRNADLSKNLIQMDSDSEYGLFSSCESNLDEEKQSIVNTIVTGSSLPGPDSNGSQGII